MSRYKITIQYDGTAYFGWQMQTDKQTVQSAIENALLPLNNGSRVKIIGAGRTDTGVHALGQVAHFDLDTNISEPDLPNAINARLSKDIRIVNLSLISDDFHARFSAKKRYYKYQCYIGENLLFKNQSWVIDKIDINELIIYANAIIGKHDFLSFSKINRDIENTICEIYESEWIESEKMFTFNISGNRFLHHMVRYLVGTMIDGVKRKIELKEFIKLLNNPSKNVKIHKAPPQGLLLMGIDYDL